MLHFLENKQQKQNQKNQTNREITDNNLMFNCCFSVCFLHLTVNAKGAECLPKIMLPTLSNIIELFLQERWLIHQRSEIVAFTNILRTCFSRNLEAMDLLPRLIFFTYLLPSKFCPPTRSQTRRVKKKFLP